MWLLVNEPALRCGPRPSEDGRRHVELEASDRTPCPADSTASYTVEAGGIEPPSEGASASASTCVACELFSPRSLPQAGSRAASRRLVSAPAPPALAGAQPEVWRSSPPYGRRQVERGGLIRQPVRSFRLQLSSPARIAG